MFNNPRIAISSKLLLFMAMFCSHASVLAKPTYLLEIDLHQAITLALAKSYDIKVATFNPKISLQHLVEQEGSFEPTIGMRYSKRRTDEFSSGFESVVGDNEFQQAALFLHGDTPWGTKYKIELNGNSNNARTGISDTSISKNIIEITQPILKGFGYEDNYAAVRIANNEYKMSQYYFEYQVTTTVHKVVNAYTDLITAQERLKVANHSRYLAQQLVTDNQKRVNIGHQAKSEMLRAEAGLAQRQDQVLFAERKVRLQKNKLKNLLADQNDDFISLQLEVTPLNLANLQILDDIDLQAEHQLALQQRPDFKQATLAIKSHQYRYQRDARRTLPSLDLTLGAEQVGISQNQSFEDAFDNQIADNLFVGLNFSMPLSNKSAKAKKRSAKLKLEREQVKLNQLKQHILVQLDNARVTVKSNEQRIKATEKSLALAQASLAAEEKKYKVGRSSAFYLLDLQQRLAQAKLQQTQVLSDYYKSLINYEFSKGNILKYYGVSL